MRNLKEKRKNNKLSQTQLAEMIGVSQKLVSFWETGRQEMPIRHAKKIAKVLKCNWKDLYDD